MAQTTIRRRQDRAVAAGIVTGPADPCKIDSMIAGGAAKKDVRVTVATASDDTAYTLTVEESEIVFTSGTGATTTTIRDGLIDAINAEDDIGNIVYAESVSAAVLKIVGLELGYDFTFSESDGNLTNAVQTAAASFEDIRFGVGVMYGDAARECQLPTQTTAVAQVTDYTPLAVHSIDYSILISSDLDGDGVEEFYGPFVITSDGTSTVAEVVDALVARMNGQLAATTFLAANSSTKLRITAENAGIPFTVSASSASDVDNWTETAVTANTARAITNPFAGVAIRNPFTEQDSTGEAYHRGGNEMGVLKEGEIYALLDASQNPSPGDDVFCRVTAGSSETVGAFRTAADSTDCVKLTNAKWLDPGGAKTDKDGKTVAKLYVAAA